MLIQKLNAPTYESTHSRPRGSGSLKDEARTETSDGAATPVSTNGNAPSADKSHNSASCIRRVRRTRIAERPKSDS